MNPLERQFFPQKGLNKYLGPGSMADEYIQGGGLFGALMNYSPHLAEAKNRALPQAQTAAEYIGPAADMQDMKNYSAATMDELRAGNYAPALANLGMTGAAMAMTALPGSVGAVGDVTKRLYHGTSKPVSDFDPTKFGANDYGSYGRGVYLSSNPDLASAYANFAAKGRGGENVMPLDVDLKNPFDATNMARLPRNAEESEKFTEKLIASGYDGVIVRGADDELTEVVVFDPSVIRSPFDSLPMDTASRMKRAEEMGFDTDAYHGTASDVREFRKDRLGAVTKARGAKNAVWLSDSPKTASGYAHHAQTEEITKLIDASQAAERAGDWDAAHDLMVKAEQLEASGGSGGANVIAAKIRGNLMRFDAEGATLSELDDGQLGDLVQKAMDGGYDGLRIDNFSDEADWGTYNPTTHYAIFDPKNVRSRHAKFDPAKKDSADLLASIGGAGLLGALGLSQSDEFNERY